MSINQRIAKSLDILTFEHREADFDQRCDDNDPAWRDHRQTRGRRVGAVAITDVPDNCGVGGVPDHMLKDSENDLEEA